MYNKIISIIPIPNYVLLQDMKEKISIDGKKWNRVAIGLTAGGDLVMIIASGTEVKAISQHDVSMHDLINDLVTSVNEMI